MKNRITAPEQVKPNFTKVKERWKNLLSKYYTSDGKLNSSYIIDVDCPHCASKKRKKSFELNALSIQILLIQRYLYAIGFYLLSFCKDIGLKPTFQ